jgi:hypothetical protein
MNLKYLVKLRLKLSNIYLEKIPKEIQGSMWREI